MRPCWKTPRPAPWPGSGKPQALICARLFSRDPKQGFDEGLVLERLRNALALREACYGTTGCYRLVYGEE